MIDEAVIRDLRSRKETVWLNPELEDVEPMFKLNGKSFLHVKAAQNRFLRFLKYMPLVFPETAPQKGLVESPLIELSGMCRKLDAEGACLQGRVFLKDDARLPIAGSVKARGGIHEVLRITETVLQKNKLLTPADDYRAVASDEIREVLGRYTIQVGSTGNLGISIGRTAARMGFHAVVHMSSDAKAWKKELLRSEGAEVIEYDGDYNEAVARGREASEKDPMSFFVDDEKSEDLFFGYSTAALRVKMQLWKLGISIDAEHPLFLYLPCGVGGAPGGITFGFKQLYGKNVHCFFAEPIEMPSFTLSMTAGTEEPMHVREIGLGGKTEADGLACGRASAFSAQMMQTLVSGTCTVSDQDMRTYMQQMEETEQLRLEVSACAGFGILSKICRPGSPYESYLEQHQLKDRLDQAIHIVWGTGGGLMPENANP